MQKVNPNNWYILRFVDRKPSLYRKGFLTAKEAKEVLKINKLNRDLTYSVIKGVDAISFGVDFAKTKKFKTFKLIGYDYPNDRITEQDKKSFRTKTRRWLRQWKIKPTKHTDFKRH